MSERIPLVYRIIPFLIICIGIVLYIPGLTGEFVWDDVTYFIYNDYITELSPFDLKFIFTQPSNYWGEMLPLRDYLFVIQYQLFGDWTVGYHVVSLFLFICSGLVLFKWVKEITQDKFVSDADGKQKQTLPIIYGSIVMALFIVNPFYVEIVAYISGQKDVLSVLFILLSLMYLYRVGKANSNKMWVLLTLGIFFHYLAIISKLSALSTIIFVPLLWLITSKHQIKQNLQLIGVWLLANIPVVFWFNYVSNMAAPFVSLEASTNISNRCLRAFNVIGTHLEHIVWPWNINYGYSFNNNWELNFAFVLGLIFAILSLGVIIKKWRSLESLCFFLIGIYLLPVLHVVQEMPNTKIYDRYLAIPIIGLLIILISSINQFTKAWRKRTLIVLGGLIVVSSFWTVITFTYIPTFKTMVISTERTKQLYPEWLNASFNLAVSLIKDGQLERAEQLIKEENDFAFWVKNYLNGRILQEKGDIKGAYQLFYAVSVVTHQQNLFLFADSHIAQIMMEKKEYNTAKAIVEGILNHPQKDPIISYQMKQLAKEIELIQANKNQLPAN
jgi:hypothetical protein